MIKLLFIKYYWFIWEKWEVNEYIFLNFFVWFVLNIDWLFKGELGTDNFRFVVELWVKFLVGVYNIFWVMSLKISWLNLLGVCWFNV